MGFSFEPDAYQIVEYDGGPCPVCGAPGGNCKGESDSASTVRFLPKKMNDPFATFVVPERIYEYRQEGSKQVRVLLYPKGARIRPEEAKRLGLM